jgi:dipeptidyl aminopeptidase/acylaminoacyl peptidase
MQRPSAAGARENETVAGRATSIHAALLAGLALLWAAGPAVGETPAAEGYRVPADAVVRLLTATRSPSGLLHADSDRVALVYRESVLPLERVARPHLGLAGFWFDPLSRTTGNDSWVERVVVLDAHDGATLATWAPAGPAALDDVQFSPDGRHLSAVSFRSGAPRLALFDVDEGRERLLDVAVNPAFGSPCTWTAADALLCRIVPAEPPALPAPFASPNVMAHPGGAAPTRTYGNLLDGAFEEAQFEHYFSASLARVTLDGSVRAFDGSVGLLARVRPSPDGRRALVIRLQRPYSHMLAASHFPRRVELWDLEKARRLDAPSLPQQRDVTPTKGRPLPGFAWKPGPLATLGWTEALEGGGERWMALDPPYTGPARELTRHADGIDRFDWTSAGTPLFSRQTDRGTRVSYFQVLPDGQPQLLWRGATKDLYSNPGRALRTDGERGPILEVSRHILLSSDGLGAEGPEPFVDALNLDTLETVRVFTSPPGVYERVVGVFDAESRGALTLRESETEPPSLYAREGGEARLVLSIANPFPDLEGVERRIVTYRRADGVKLSGMLYLPRERAAAEPLPTLIWIYPREYSESEYAEQFDERRFRFHRVRGASPIAVTLAGYALLLNPTMPIIGEGEQANDAYVPQLVASARAAVDYLVGSGISDRERIAVGGHSYGAFSTSNLLVHSDLFRTGLAFSGAYNRTLTPFGFQHEKRSFWKATDFYARMSPFFLADEIEEPLLLMHGGADDNPGTPTTQARRFFHALVGNGVPARYVELPYERHHYRARESVLHAAAEMIDWLDRTIGPEAPAPAR